jgi:hypothetical protein
MKTPVRWIVIAALLCAGCSQMAVVPYEQVEKTNRVRVRLNSGPAVEGTVLKADPVQLILNRPGGGSIAIPRERVASVRRMTPVRDEFGRGISEEEIRSGRTGRRSAVYAVGGGALSLGFSFFAGSLLGHASPNGGAVLAGTAAAGTALGTVLFSRAGRARDRQAAIDDIRIRRRNVDPRPDAAAGEGEDLNARIERERRMREAARREREELLREIESGKQDRPTR